MNICSYSSEEYIDLVKSFHGHAAPGIVIGGFMVDLAYKHLPEEGLFDAISETPACLPDAIQLLTPCTIGNGWLRVIDTGRFALIIYETTQGEGIRGFLYPARIEARPEIKAWFFHLKPKKEPDSQLLMEQIMEAGLKICSTQRVRVKPHLITEEKHRDKFTICPLCTESYLADDGEILSGASPRTPSKTLVNSEAAK